MASLVKKLGNAIFGGGSSSTYSAPNLDFLRGPAPTVNYDFLRTAADTAGGMASRGRTYADYLTPTQRASTGAFQDYVGTINAPSSVDQVRSEVEASGLERTLGDIERNTRQRFGSSIMDSYLRGLTGDGNDSDIARVGMAQVAAEGGRTASDAVTRMYLANLDRLGARESAAREAYGSRYAYGEQGDLARERMAADLASGAASGYNQLMASGEGMRGDLLRSYASGLQSDADREMQRRLGLAGSLTQSASAQAQNTQKNRGIARDMSLGFASGFGQALGAKMGG